MGTPQYGDPAVSYAQVQGYMGGDPTEWMPGISVKQSEDCLYLNVFTPAVAPNASETAVCAPPNCNVCAECCHTWIQPGKNCEECYRDSCNASSVRAANSSIPRLLPVLLWIHGGAFENGAGSLALYNGTRIIDMIAEQANAATADAPAPEQVLFSRARPRALSLSLALSEPALEQVVVVTINYRLNVFGFLGSSELANASHDGSTGNYGLQDQRLAMQWVQKNIHAFGGDKSRVMIFGESAGAASVAAHTVMPRSIGDPRLFSRAALESGGYSVWDAHGLNTSQQTFNQLAGLLCPSSSNETLLRCLREKDTATVSLMAQLLPKPCNAEFCCKWAPTVDGVELPAHPFALATKPEPHGVTRAAVPILLGTNLDEDASFVGQSEGPLYWNMTQSDFAKFAKGLYNFTASQINELASLYPPSSFPRTEPSADQPYQLPYSPSWWGSIRAASDQDMGCPARRGASWFAAKHGVWLYHFTRARNGSVTVPHGAELQYVWRDLSALSPPTGTVSDVALSESILGYFLNFARSGDPNNPGGTPPATSGLPFWPRFEANTPRGDVTMQLDVGEKLLPLLERSAAECAWWARNDPCYIGGQMNATQAQKQYAQRLGCGTL